MAGPLDGHLAAAACNNVLVTFAAALRVIRRPEAVLDRFDLFVNEPVVVERTKRNYIFLVQRVERRALLDVIVRQVVEPGRSFDGVTRAAGLVVSLFIQLEGKVTRGRLTGQNSV